MRCHRDAGSAKRSIPLMASRDAARKAQSGIDLRVLSINRLQRGHAFGGHPVPLNAGSFLRTRQVSAMERDNMPLEENKTKRGGAEKFRSAPFRVFVTPCVFVKALVGCCKRRWGCFGSGSLIRRWQFSLCGWGCYCVGIAGTADDQGRKQQTGQCDTHVNS
jgi:hypothetical protein